MKNNLTHWDGEKYAKISSPQFNINKAFIAEHSFENSDIILDVGCGNGDTTRLLAQLTPNGTVMGIDASKTMIESARNSHNPANVNFQWIQAQKINDINKFDKITCFFVCSGFLKNK